MNISAQSLLLLGAVCGLACSAASAEQTLRLRARDVRLGETPNLLKERTIGAAQQSRVLSLDGPMSPERRAALARAGVQVRGFLEGDSFLVSGAAVNPQALERLGFVRGLTDFKPEWKIAPGLAGRPARNFADAARERLRDAGKLALIVSLEPGADPGVMRTRLGSLAGAQVLRIENAGGDSLAVMALPANQLGALSRIPGVHFIDEFPEYEDRNLTARWVIQSNTPAVTPFYAAGLTGTGQIMGIVEASGKIDSAHCSFSDPVNPIGPLHRKIVSLSSSLSVGQHATHVSGTCAGDGGSETETRGVAYGARIAFANGLSLNESTIFNLFTLNYSKGAFVHNNSWGNKNTNAYDVTCRAVDNFSWLNSDCLLVFATAEAGPLTNPENAKNCLATVACGDSPNQESLYYYGTVPLPLVTAHVCPSGCVRTVTL